MYHKKMNRLRKHMPLNEHLVAFNDARNEANLMDAHEFVFRGKTYHRGTWKKTVCLSRIGRTAKSRGGNRAERSREEIGRRGGQTPSSRYYHSTQSTGDR